METNPACLMVPSISVQQDTSGVVFQNEFVLFRNYSDPSVDFSNAVLSARKSTFVTNAEYQEFQNWVRDSMAREVIYQELKNVDFMQGLTFLDLTREEWKNKEVISKNNYEENRYTHKLNWNTKFSYSDPELLPLTALLYLQPSERFYKLRNFDDRKLIYQYLESIEEQENGATQMTMQTPTIIHKEYWAQKSTSINDEFSVLGQAYTELLPEQPVIGLTGMQANAFCFWKELQLQQLLNEKKLPYQAVVTLPQVSELTNSSTSISVPAKDYTSLWKITVTDYQLFRQAVLDSSVMEILYQEIIEDKEAQKLLSPQSSYFSEPHQAMAEFDPSDRRNNRQLFPFTKNLSILKKYTAHYNSIRSRDYFDQFRYYRMDVTSKALVGKSVPLPYYIDNERYVQILVLAEADSLGDPLGMDLNLDYVNILMQGTGVKSHEDYSRFIDQVILDISPGVDFHLQKPEDLAKAITYEQALAYYHWKYPIWKAKSGDNWQNYVYPSEEQFTKIQNGEQIIVPEHQVEFPSPTFRYVVTFIPR